MQLFAFTSLSVVYRNQLLHVYSPGNDTGGMYWLPFAQILVYCILVAEVTTTAVLSLKKAPAEAVLMLPLIFSTAYYLYYISQQHYR